MNSIYFDKISRGLIVGIMLNRGECITSKKLRAKFNISMATANRDMIAIESTLPVEAEIGKRNQVILRLIKNEM